MGNRNTIVIRGTLTYLLVWILNSTCSFAQVRQIAEIMPQFEGSVNGLKQWLAQNMAYPQEAIQNKEEGRVVVKFVIREDGTVAQPIITSSVSPSLDAEAVRLVSQMPKWIPASQDGQPCSIEYSLPIRFKLPEPQLRNNVVAQSTNNRSKTDQWEQLSSHKTYEGPFEAFGLFEDYGKAKYQYIENPDGTRVFDGKFVFKADDLEVKGSFKNDFQDGQWIFNSKGKTTFLTFVNGRPTGSFVMYELQTNFTDGTDGKHIVMSHPKYEGHIWGTPSSPGWYFSTLESTTSKGYHVKYHYQFQLERDTYKKKWHEVFYRAEVADHKEIQWEKYIGFYIIDNCTGDKQYFDLGKYLPDVVLAKIIINKYLLRSTGRKYYGRF